MAAFLTCFHKRCEVAETWLHRKVRKSLFEVSDTTIYILLVYTDMTLSFCFAMSAMTKNLNMILFTKYSMNLEGRLPVCKWTRSVKLHAASLKKME